MKKRRALLITAAVFAAIVLLLILCRLFWLQPMRVVAGSMMPTLQKGDLILVDKLAYSSAKPQRGDIVLFNADGFASEHTIHNKNIIKRIIALPGQRISIRPPYIYVNDSPLEDFPGVVLPNETLFPHAPLKADSDEITLSPGRYFLIGDNITVSLDSRHFGPADSSSFIGKVTRILAPADRRRQVE